MANNIAFEVEQVPLDEVITADEGDFVLGFGARVSVLRKRAGFSIGDLAVRVGLSERTLERCESGSSSIDLVTLKDFDVARFDRNFILDGQPIDHYVETYFDWNAIAAIATGLARDYKRCESPVRLEVVAAAMRTMYRAYRQRERAKQKCSMPCTSK